MTRPIRSGDDREAREASRAVEFEVSAVDREDPGELLPLRDADQGGLTYWVAQLDHGASLDQMEAALLNSTEYHNKASNLLGDPTADFIYSLYQDILHRTPSVPELDQLFQAFGGVS